MTGAANGIGRAIALELGTRGAQLALIDMEEAADAAAMQREIHELSAISGGAKGSPADRQNMRSRYRPRKFSQPRTNSA